MRRRNRKSDEKPAKAPRGWRDGGGSGNVPPHPPSHSAGAQKFKKNMKNKDIEDKSNWVETPSDMERLIGEQMGKMHVGEHAWHSVSAAIECMEKREDLRALMLLRTLRHFLSKATGHEVEER